ncbi:hypothetical protein EYZ11_001752 [Aspergillus tanneri]|uniref:SHSP domain-containing protein n=1 Tax=Aspergillus tanneri TaxID=1220188 RepID=A0A4S3JSG7_9EURO|nr:uncharacterized protein ATNIH1004_000868 [Aspergillus tanneri]KAA8651968.1 hypothetical protein ATNIH1004_000868 [Aspergillus tanneri]THC98773.1 hypothetical protein EYZ11_001752 [Aspergillus tanneri]
MSSIRYYNQPSPFWDFVTNMEEQGSSHPFFTGTNNNCSQASEGDDQWAGAWGFRFGGPFASRSRPGAPLHHHVPVSGEREPGHEGDPVKEQDYDKGPSAPRGPPPPFSQHPCHFPGAHGGCGDARPRGWGAGGPSCCGFGPMSSFPPWGGFGPNVGFGTWGGFGPNAGFRPWGGFGPNAGFRPWGGFGPLGGFGFEDGATRYKHENFKPDVDVYDTPDTFVINVSLSGAKKEDVGVNWDSEKFEFSITGAIHRPGDEEFRKTLALDERKVGRFERKVRLGGRANPAQIDIDAVTARMEDGILTIDVPKLDSGYAEIKKVDIQ